MTARQANSAWLRRLKEAGGSNLTGFQVEALDGSAGRIDRVLYWSDAMTPDYVIVGSRRWIFGHKAVLSIDVIEDIDMVSRTLLIRLSKEQVRRAPEFLPGS